MDWPTSLPQYVDIAGYTEKRGSAKLETQMDSGPEQMRNLFTAVPVYFTINLTLTSAQVTVLDTFYYTTTKNGTLEFDWLHPRTYASATMRFFGEPPSIGYKAYDAFTASFSVEILP
jgi:hypothetical protein